MFKARKEKAQAKVAAVKEKIAARHDKPDVWISQVTTPDGSFGTFEAWKQIYEPAKEPKEAKEKPESERVAAAKAKLALKAKTNLANNVALSTARTIIEVVSKLCTLVEEKIPEQSLKGLFNSSNALLLTFRFETKKNGREMSFLRTCTIDKLGQFMLDTLSFLQQGVTAATGALATAASASEKAQGAAAEAADATAKLESLDVEALMNQFQSQIDPIVEARTAEALAKLQETPLFHVAPEGAADQAVEQAQAGFQILKAVIRGFIEGRVKQIIGLFIGKMKIVLALAHKNRPAIEAFLAQSDSTVAAAQANLDTFMEGSGEYGAYRKEVKDTVEHAYADLIKQGSDMILTLLTQATAKCEDADEEEAEA